MKSGLERFDLFPHLQGLVPSRLIGLGAGKGVDDVGLFGVVDVEAPILGLLVYLKRHKLTLNQPVWLFNLRLLDQRW